MDEYAEYLYKKRPHYRNIDPGDLTEQRAIRTKLNCKPFKWFMEQVAFDLPKYYPPVEPKPLAYGEVGTLGCWNNTDNGENDDGIKYINNSSRTTTTKTTAAATTTTETAIIILTLKGETVDFFYPKLTGLETVFNMCAYIATLQFMSESHVTDHFGLGVQTDSLALGTDRVEIASFFSLFID